MALGFQTGAFQATAFQGGAAVAPEGHGFEMGGAHTVSFKPLLQRILEERAKPIAPPQNKKARKRVRVIEVEAAQEVLAGNGEERFAELMRQWLAASPAIPQENSQTDANALFMAQVAFRVRQIQFEQDEEEALIALLA